MRGRVAELAARGMSRMRHRALGQPKVVRVGTGDKAKPAVDGPQSTRTLARLVGRPRGFCAQREHPEQTAVRELREETGLAVRLLGLAGIWLDSYPARHRPNPECTLNIYYFAELEDEDQESPPDPHEVAEVAWLSSEGIPEQLAFPVHIRPAVESWRRFIAR